MKFKYIFILVVIALIGGSIYIVYNNNKPAKRVDDEYVDTEIQGLDLVENMKIAISNYDTMNPLLTNNNEIINLNKIIFEPLVNITDDFHTEMCLAKEVKKVNDRTYEITVDTSIKWADGSGFNAYDVEYTINLLKYVNTVYTTYVNPIERVEVNSDEKLTLYLNRSINFFEYNLNFPIVSKAYYNGEDFMTSSKIPLGTGMYRISSIDERNILLVRNDRWHDIKKFTPRTKSITIQKHQAIGEAFNKFKLNNVDVVNTYLTNYTDYVGTMGYNRKEYKGRDYEFISFNCNDGIMSNVEVRRAIAYAINNDVIANNTLGGRKLAANSPLDYGSYLDTQDELCKNNQEAAKKTLFDAGWSFENNRWRKDDKVLELNMVVRNDDADRITAAAMVRDQVGEVGILLNIVQVNADRYYQYLNERNYQIIVTGIRNQINPDLSLFFGENNLANYNNEEAKKNINNLDKYKEILKKANEDVPYIGLYRNKGIVLFNANMGGNISCNPFNLYNNFKTWYRQQ